MITEVSQAPSRPQKATFSAAAVRTVASEGLALGRWWRTQQAWFRLRTKQWMSEGSCRQRGRWRQVGDVLEAGLWGGDQVRPF